MNCTKCGGKLSSSDNFCKLCGAPAAVKIDLPPAEPSAETVSRTEGFMTSQTQYYPSPDTAPDAENSDSGFRPPDSVLQPPGLTPDSRPYASWPNSEPEKSTPADGINTYQNQFGSKAESIKPSQPQDYLNSGNASASESSDSGSWTSEPDIRPQTAKQFNAWPNTDTESSVSSENAAAYQNQTGSKPESFEPAQNQGFANPAAENNASAERSNAYQNQFRSGSENPAPQPAQGYQNQYRPQQQGGGYAYSQNNYNYPPQQNQSGYVPPQYQQGAQNAGYGSQQMYQGYQQSSYPPQQTINIGNYQQQVSYSREADRPNIGLNILSFFFASVGLIIYLLIYSEKPVKAKSIGRWSLIGFGASIVLYIITAFMNMGIV